MEQIKPISTSKKRFSIKPKSRNFYFEIMLCVILITFVIIPLFAMLTKIDKSTIIRVFNDKSFSKSLINSLTTTTTATIISVVIAYGLAWSISRTTIKCKGLFSVVLILPMLIPSISHGMGLVIMFGNNGILRKKQEFSHDKVAAKTVCKKP